MLSRWLRGERRLPDPPEELGVYDGVAFARFRPPDRWGSVLILHGAGSCKESHFDFARAARAVGLEAVALDLPGHGDSGGAMDEDVVAALADVASALLPVRPLAIRGSSMGGHLAIASAGAVGASAVVAICPASGAGMARGLERGLHGFDAAPGLGAFFGGSDLGEIVAELDVSLLLMHAEGDEIIPSSESEALYAAARMAQKRLLIVPGGHHRSIQHDDELRGESLRWLERVMTAHPPRHSRR